MTSLTRRRAFVFGASVMLVAGAIGVGRLATQGESTKYDLPRAAEEFLGETGEKDLQESSQGVANGGSGGEAAELQTAMEQFAQARTAPGIVNPGAYSDAFNNMTGLGATAGSWDEVTNVPYDADDPNYRDYYSNSSGGSGLVTGRITGLAADGNGNVYAGGADGGVWRSTTGGGHWTPIADDLPSLSTGDLQLDPHGVLWYATGEANTGGTSYVGSGVYRLEKPKTGTFSMSDQVGGDELESTTINAIRFGGDRVWVATLRGVYSHSDSTADGSWTLSFAPNETYLPGGDNADDPNAAYKNIVNDIAIDPKDPDHLIAAAGWRSGDTYNGFYETTDGGATPWVKIKPTGAINPKDIGNASFAWSSKGEKLYVMNQSPILLNKRTGTVNSYLDGIYVSNNGSIDGPWSKVADQRKLANSGSALKQSIGGKGYGPGIQSWYNQFLIVDPQNADHVYAGLEEVYETTNGGSGWNTVGPYWNFYFSCWRPDSEYPPNGTLGCPQTTHPDQHSAAVGTDLNGDTWIYVGNDGGVYRRPIDGETNRNGNATDWESLNDGSIDALQYYAVGVGLAAGEFADRAPAGDGAIVSGGLQDNGGSVMRVGGSAMSSNFGGDGGDVLVDPEHGCNIVQEYVYLSMELTWTCANPQDPTYGAFFDKSLATTVDISPPDINARFIAPFVADAGNIDNWLAGGHSIWFQTNGFGIRSGSEWEHVYTIPGSAARVATAMAYTTNAAGTAATAIVGWCGTCNNAGFTRGLSIGEYAKQADDTWKWTWHEADLTNGTPGDTSDDLLPNRYVGGVAVDGDGNLFLAMNGFSRRFTEGPGAGIGHIFESTDHGATWTDIGGDPKDAGNFPDVPASSIKVTSTGGIVVGTDLGVLYRASGSTTWQRLGTNFPATVVMDVELGPDGNLCSDPRSRHLDDQRRGPVTRG